MDVPSVTVSAGDEPDQSSEHAPSAPTLGRWSFDLRTGLASYDADLVEMYDLGLASSGSPEEIQRHMHPDDVEAMQEQTARALRDPAPMTGRYRLRTRSHGERTFVIVADPEVVEGRVVGLVGYAIDVTDDTRRTADDAVRASAASRAGIEQVKGALMTAYALDGDAAFELLRKTSMNCNVKLAELASRVVARLRDPDDTFHQVHQELPLLQLLEETARSM